MAEKKEKLPETLGEKPQGEESTEGGAESDPYLDQLDSSMEDLISEEPTSFDIPAPESAEGELEETPPFTEEPELAPSPEPEAPESLAPERDEALERASNIPVEVRVVIGDKQTTLAELLQLKKGGLMELDKGLDASVDLMVQDKVVARGELVEVDGRLGVRITRVVEESS